MDSQAEGEDGGHEPCTAVAISHKGTRQVYVRPRIANGRQTIACSEQSKDECLSERDRRHLQYQKMLNYTRVSAYIRHDGHRVRYADRHHRQDSGAYQYEHDPTLCPDFRNQYRERDEAARNEDGAIIFRTFSQSIGCV